MQVADLQKFKKILLVGYGVEGHATEEYIRRVHPEAVIETADQQKGPDYLSKQKEFDLAVRSPGVKKELLSIPYTTATNIFFANISVPVVGVTGSKGKSTTAALIHSIIQEAGYDSELVGNIGIPLLSSLLKNQTPDFYVAELSSFQLDDIKYSPHIAVIVNIFPEHMDYHGSFEAYWHAKTNIVKHQTEEDYFVYNPKFEQIVELSKTVKSTPVPFTKNLKLDQYSIPLVGEHNRENVKAAATVAEILGLNPETVEAAVTKFRPLPHRLQNIGTFKTLTFYDDAISTTPQSTIEALKSLKNIGTLFLGGKDRGYNFADLVKMVLDLQIPNIVIFPDSGKQILDEFNKQTKQLPNILETSSMEEAVKWAYEVSPKNSIVLLSTASPSYSLWKNFEQKGDSFKEFVLKYSN